MSIENSLEVKYDTKRKDISTNEQNIITTRPRVITEVVKGNVEREPNKSLSNIVCPCAQSGGATLEKSSVVVGSNPIGHFTMPGYFFNDTKHSPPGMAFKSSSTEYVQLGTHGTFRDDVQICRIINGKDNRDGNCEPKMGLNPVHPLYIHSESRGSVQLANLISRLLFPLWSKADHVWGAVAMFLGFLRSIPPVHKAGR